MKKITIICIATLAIFSCKKETKNTESTNTVSSAYFADENPSTDWEPRIKMYLDDMNGVGLGDYDTTSLDSTIFYMEAAVNYEYANFENQLDTVFEKTDTLNFTVPISVNDVYITDAKNAYDGIVSFVSSEYNSITSANKTLKAVNIGIFNNSGTVITLQVDVILGKGAHLNYEVGPRTISGDRYWDWSSGFCNGNAGNGAMKEIVRLGNYNMNLAQIAVRSGYRFFITNIPPRKLVGPGSIKTYNTSNPYASPTGNYYSDVWAYQSTVANPIGPCIVESEQNWYLGRIPTIITNYRESGQTFINIDGNFESTGSSPFPYYHDFRINYGKIQITVDPSKM